MEHSTSFDLANMCSRCRMLISRNNRDLELINKIQGISNINKEAIARISELTKNNEIIVSYRYTITESNSLYVLNEQKTVIPAIDIRDSWKTQSTLCTVEDFFNDKLDYSCTSYQDIVRLNQSMLVVARKYRIFECTRDSLNVLEQFKKNFEELQIYLGEIEAMLENAKSKRDVIQPYVDQLNEAMSRVKTEYNMKSIMKQLQTLNVTCKPLFDVQDSLGTDYTDQIQEWLPMKKFKLLYRGSRDGFRSIDFHSRCDNQKETLTLIKTSEGNMFGGYTPIEWNSSGEDICDGDTFIFTLKNQHNVPPTKFVKREPNEQDFYQDLTSIFDDSHYGPCFGIGTDIGIEDACNRQNGGWSYFPGSFIDTTNMKSSIFGTSFQVEEIEVYKATIQ
eukprot:TRINITY_DN11600_c0_g1_i1.p1 TRINITY_DN11600_c0_g1~~TRINITY_DN11600_c0_g1_i1.p1  ORF type:complete len:391 (-),score=52.83 TRINITY_DN11600_c0_g1_i1:107-1279(-)